MEKSRYCPAGNYMFKVKNRNTRTRGEILNKKIKESLKIMASYELLI